jgi:hypothetical protein
MALRWVPADCFQVCARNWQFVCCTGGCGAVLVLALMMAAAGAIPPDVVLPVSFCLHSVWLSVGRQFEGWLQAAVLQLAPEGAPWQRQ